MPCRWSFSSDSQARFRNGSAAANPSAHCTRKSSRHWFTGGRFVPAPDAWLHGAICGNVRVPGSFHQPFYLRKPRRRRGRLRLSVFPSSGWVNNLLIRIITEHLWISCIRSQDVSVSSRTIYCPACASLAHQTATTQLGRGFHLPHMWQYYLEGLIHADIQKSRTGKCNPGTYGARSFRRNSSSRGRRLRSFSQIPQTPRPT